MAVTVAAGIVECQLGAMINSETSVALSPYPFPSLLGWCCHCTGLEALGLTACGPQSSDRPQAVLSMLLPLAGVVSHGCPITLELGLGSCQGPLEFMFWIIRRVLRAKEAGVFPNSCCALEK